MIRSHPKLFSYTLWFIIGLIGTISLSAIAFLREEKISSLWLIASFVCIQLIAYRFYSLFIATKALHIDGRHVTPAKKYNDGKDFVPTNKWMVFGHHFAAIAGPGPLIGPTLAAQFGYLPGTLWILVGCVLGGAVQDMVILFASIRRDGKSLGQMIKDEIGATAGYVALVATLAIITILISVLALIIVKALMHSPWGTATVSFTIPIAMLVGIYLFYIRPGAIVEASIIGVILFLLAVYGGQYINAHPALATFFDRDAKFLAWSVMIYGFAAAALPIWLLLAPRDYLSSFLKLGTIFLLAIAIFVFHPTIQMPALTGFIDGSGPIFSGKVFPFLFITIACGAISGFHALVASGTTPKMVSDERDIRLIGYGSMLLEGFVAVMAIIAACILEPGIYFAINSPSGAVGGDALSAISTINSSSFSGGFAVTKDAMDQLAVSMGETTLFGRTGGAPSLAVGMANIFSSAFGKNMLAMWYHFAIMFEAVFILTTLDAGTRVARFMLQDLLGNFYKPLGNNHHYLSALFSSFVIVAGWGYFLYLGVLDPNGGVNILWPLFGISNQMLAGIALSLALVILYKHSAKKIYCLIAALPLLAVTTITTTAAYEKIFSDNIKIGFFAAANNWKERLASAVEPSAEFIKLAESNIFNQQLVAYITIIFAVMLWIVIICALSSILNARPQKSNKTQKEFMEKEKRKWSKINRCC